LRVQPRNAVAIGILLTIVSFGLSSGRLPISPSANADSQAFVSLYADGSKHLFSTDAATVGDVLQRANVKLADGDIVEPSANTRVKGQFNINVYRARNVLVTDGLKSYHIKSAYQSPRLLALAAGLTVYAEDKYKTEVITDIVGHDALGEQVIIDRAKPLVVKVDGATRTIRTQAGTVGDALKDAGIALGLKDAVSDAPTAPVIPGDTVQITRVSEVVATITQALPHATKTIADPTVLKGQTAVKVAGVDGQKTTTYRIHYQDGVETSREALQVVSQTAPVDTVQVVGTKVLFAGSVEYWRPMVEQEAAKWDFDPNTMMRIMACESKGNATSVSQFIINGEHPTGLFQYLPSTWRAAGGTDDNILDGAAQIRVTAKKMALYGTGPWQCK
jgi:uncharacterized protein YabE (DUF348 family)